MCEISENKREMFDGMRAYHQSEINHCNHAITMLLSIAAGAGAVVFAILFQEYTPKNIGIISWGLFIVVSVFSLTIAATSHLKINGDHKAYSSFGREYVKSSILLGLYDKKVPYESENMEVLKTSQNIGQGNGYKETQIIIWSFSITLISLTFLFALLITRLI